MLNRRHFLQSGLAAASLARISAAVQQQRFATSASILQAAIDRKQITSAAMWVNQRDASTSYHFGQAVDGPRLFLLGSITKPICLMAAMKLYERGDFRLDDPAIRYLPEFKGSGRDQVTIRHLMTHTSGLPDQLANNAELRKQHAPLSEFVAGAMKTNLSFVAGTNYQYSSMGILLATRIAEVISGNPISKLVDEFVVRPLQLKQTALGVGHFENADLVPMQTESAAPESGAGDPSAKLWDWNSEYWRKLGAPWGGMHSSAHDVAKILTHVLHPEGGPLRSDTCRLMSSNQNPPGLKPRGLGFDLGTHLGGPGLSEITFGHTGSTGTIAWADPKADAVCVVLTSLPARAVTPHPRTLTSQAVAQEIGAAQRMIGD